MSYQIEWSLRREPFDYTEWQEHLFDDMSIEEISRRAVEYRKVLVNAAALS
jgi:hypothetical protein